MEKTLVEALVITNVYQRERYRGRIDIHFTVKDFEYLLMMKDLNGTFQVGIVSHNNNHYCSICDQLANVHTTNSIICETLDQFSSSLFHRLIEMPSIRLEWLYLPH